MISEESSDALIFKTFIKQSYTRTKVWLPLIEHSPIVEIVVLRQKKYDGQQRRYKIILKFFRVFLNYSGVQPVCCWKVNSGLSFLDTFVFVINYESIKSEVTIKSVRKHFQNLNFSPPFSVIRTDSAWFKFVWPYKEIRECDSFAWFSLRMNRNRVVLSTTEQL